MEEQSNNSLDFDIQLATSDSVAKTDSQGPEVTGSVASAERSDNPHFYPKFLNRAAHPGFCITHLSFKVLGLLVYILFGLFTSDRTLCFIITVIMASFDFWVTKNLTGR